MYNDWLNLYLARIHAIHNKPFSSNDIHLTISNAKERARVGRILRNLKSMGYVSKSPRAYQYKHWQHTKLMPRSLYILAQNYDAWYLVHKQGGPT